MRQASVWPVCLLLAMLLGCSPAPDDPAAFVEPPSRPEPSEVTSAQAEAVSGGTVTVLLPDEPTTLHPWMSPGHSSVGAITRSVLAPLWRVRPDGTPERWLLAQEPTVRQETATTPFTIVYRIRDDAVWSDGETIDGRDVLFTLGTCLRDAPRNDCAGVDLRRSRADGKRATVAFERPVADWQAVLASLPVLPEHVLRGQDQATAWTRRIPVASGPFAFSSWMPGQRLVLERNQRWWGQPATLDRLEFRFGTDSATDTVAAVASGTADVAQLPASTSVVEQARADTRVRGIVGPGARWAALDFNLASPWLERRAVRRALAAAIDRQVIVAELIAPVDATAEVLQTPLADVAADTLRYPAHDTTAAERQLDAAGCERTDPADATTTRRCGDAPLLLDLVVDSGGWHEPVLADYVRRQLTDIGVDVRVTHADVPLESSEPIPPTDGEAAWDLRITTVDASSEAERWRCDAPVNIQSFCDRRYDAAVDRAAATIQARQHEQARSTAARVLADDVPTLPMYEIPEVLLHATAVRGPVRNAGPWGLTWNVEAWARTTDSGASSPEP